MEVELKEMLNDLDYLKKSLSNPSNLASSIHKEKGGTNCDAGLCFVRVDESLYYIGEKVLHLPAYSRIMANHELLQRTFVYFLVVMELFFQKFRMLDLYHEQDNISFHI
ncbi:hypothetical protein NC651_033072 [Populus alba x Populus x berolinensis]|nr:hypothetical protein NC651_033072 [Populus alba x Populus x berolinensis]